MSAKDNAEFKNAIRDISYFALRLDSQYDRVRCCEWVRALVKLPDDQFETAKMRNEYAQYLRIMVRSGFLHSVFLKPPAPEALKPLPEALGANLWASVPNLPSVGPIAPFISHKSPDGRAYVSIKRIPGSGVLCYMAVTPDEL